MNECIRYVAREISQQRITVVGRKHIVLVRPAGERFEGNLIGHVPVETHLNAVAVACALHVVDVIERLPESFAVRIRNFRRVRTLGEVVPVEAYRHGSIDAVVPCTVHTRSAGAYRHIDHPVALPCRHGVVSSGTVLEAAVCAVAPPVAEAHLNLLCVPVSVIHANAIAAGGMAARGVQAVVDTSTVHRNAEPVVAATVRAIHALAGDAGVRFVALALPSRTVAMAAVGALHVVHVGRVLLEGLACPSRGIGAGAGGAVRVEIPTILADAHQIRI